MYEVINTTVEKLSLLRYENAMDWDTFDKILSEIEDINICNEEDGETILSEYLLSGYFYHDGLTMIEVIKRFINNGYDVKAHHGKNGILVLNSLCKSSYDRYVLDVAKFLLNIESPTIYKSKNDILDVEIDNVLDNIAWGLVDAWNLDQDYDWANILEAYYTMVDHYNNGKNYASIDCHLECLNHKVTAIKTSRNHPFLKQKETYKFADSFVIWFDEKPLVISPYIDFVVDPVWVEKNNNILVNANSLFSEIIGATLIKIKHIDATCSYFEFDNGYRLILATQDIKEKHRSGAFEIRKIEKNIGTFANNFTYIACLNGGSYREKVVNYNEETVVLFDEEKATVIFLSADDCYEQYCLCTIQCSKELLAEYDRKLVLPPIEDIKTYYEGNLMTTMRIHCGDKYLYLLATAYPRIYIKVSSIKFDLSDKSINFEYIQGEKLIFKC